jgi:TPR repeat protein
LKYSICRSGVEIGDFEEYEFREKLKANEIVPRDWYWHEGMTEWRRLEEIYPVRQKERDAAAQTDADTLVREGNKLYLSNGRGVTEANLQAFRLFFQAATEGNDEAQFSLGVCYRDGNGGPQDYSQAARWFRMAAEQGHAEAQFCLGNCLRLGHGVPQDYAEAVGWFRMAAGRGNADAQFALGVITLQPSS